MNTQQDYCVGSAHTQVGESLIFIHRRRKSIENSYSWQGEGVGNAHTGKGERNTYKEYIQAAG